MELTDTEIKIPSLVVFAKRPRLGFSKQRLAQEIGAEPAFEIAQSLFECAIEDAQNWPGPAFLSTESIDDLEWATQINRQYNFPFNGIVPQLDGNLGERLNQVDYEIRSRDINKTVFIGTDSPALNSTIYNSVIQALKFSDYVVSPAIDGGVTIMANKLPWPDIKALPWSNKELGNALEKECKKLGCSYKKVDQTYDIDVLSDILKLKSDLINDKRVSRVKLLSKILSVI